MKHITIKDLRSLPAFLTIRNLRLRGFLDAVSDMQHYVEMGIVDSVGEGCYHNVLAGNYETFSAIRTVIKLPIYGHVSILHHYGVITQIPQYLNLYIIDQLDAPHLNGVEMHHRSSQWLRDMYAQGGVMPTRKPSYDKAIHKNTSPVPIPSIHPQFAYNDMVEYHSMCGLDPDDFDWDFMDVDDDITFLLPVPEPESTFDSVHW